MFHLQKLVSQFVCLFVNWLVGLLAGLGSLFENIMPLIKVESVDGVIGIATRCGLGGPAVESRWGARFSSPIQTGSGAHPASCTKGTGSFPGVKAAGTWC